MDSSLSIYQAAGTFANLPAFLTVFLLLLFGVIGYFAMRRRLDQDSERSLADTEEMSGSAQSLLQTLNDEGLTIPLVLALVLLFLPYALGTLLLPFVVPYLIMAFFHVVQLYPDARVRDMATGHYRLVMFVVELGVWWSFFTTLQRIFTPFWYGVRNLYYSSTLLPIDPYLDLLINWSWTLLPLLAAAIAAFLTTPSVADMVWEEFFPQEIDAEDQLRINSLGSGPWGKPYLLPKLPVKSAAQEGANMRMLVWVGGIVRPEITHRPPRSSATRVSPTQNLACGTQPAAPSDAIRLPP